MPKLSKSTVYFNNRKFDRDLSVNASGEFSMLLPPEIQKATGKDKVYGNTKDEVEGVWLTYADEWKKSKVEKRNVLAVKYAHQRPARHSNDSFCTEGMLLEVKCYPFEETATTNGKGEVRYDYKYLEPEDYDLPDAITQKSHSMIGYNRGARADKDGDIILLPLTAEACTFMADLEARLLGLQEKLAAVLTKPDKLEQAIKQGAGQFLLEAPKKAAKK